MSVNWKDGLPWLLLAAKEVKQESNSPNKLVFGHTVLRPLVALQNDWKEVATSEFD